MKTKNDYTEHDADNINEGWEAVEEYVQDAVLIAFDECHKIYLAMDETEAQFFRENYQPAIVERIHSTPDDMLALLHEWFDISCGLKFIQAVWHDAEDPNAGFVSLIGQGASDPADDCPECGYGDCDGYCQDDEEDEDDEDEE